MKKIVCACIATLSLCLVASMSTFAINYIDDKDIKATETIESNNVASMDNLADVEREGEIMFGTFERKEVELKGEILQDAPRIALDDVVHMLNDGMDYAVIENELAEIQSEPDFIGGSGITNIEYWLDDTGNDKILLIPEQKEIIHIKVGVDGMNNVSVEVLLNG